MKKIIVILFLLVSCKGSAELESKLQEAVEQLKPAQEQFRQQAADELEKTYTFEYKVEDFDISSSSLNIETRLKELGQERWDCFSSQLVDKNLKIFCKRKPKSYLNYVPRIM